MKKVILIFVLSISIFTHAQQSKTDSLIYLNGFSWKMGDQKLSSREFKIEIAKTPAALPYFKKGRTNSILSKVFFTGAAVTGLLAILDSKSDPWIYNKGNKVLHKNLVSVAFLAAGTITWKFALKNKGKAVHLRNIGVMGL